MAKLQDCEGCKKTPQYGDVYCRNCGEELQEQDLVECECGARVFVEDNYCHKCGAEFEGIEEEDEGSEEEQEEPEEEE
jgi:DNA-directed RNA polymerase subunit RPC12/RpoP